MDSSSSVIIKAQKGSYFSRLLVQGMLILQALWVEEKRNEGWAEIREDGADGSRKLSAQVSLLYLDKPLQLHWRDAATADEPAHESLTLGLGSEMSKQYADPGST